MDRRVRFSAKASYMSFAARASTDMDMIEMARSSSEPFILCPLRHAESIKERLNRSMACIVLWSLTPCLPSIIG